VVEVELPLGRLAQEGLRQAQLAFKRRAAPKVPSQEALFTSVAQAIFGNVVGNKPATTVLIITAEVRTR